MSKLKKLRERISSVKSTRKITSAMKMVAASKLKRAQDAAVAAQPYAKALAVMVSRVAEGAKGSSSNKLLVGTGADKRHLLIVCSSDRGLCGGFNGGIARQTRTEVRKLTAAGKNVEIICVGRKASDMLRREFMGMISDTMLGVSGRVGLSFVDALKVSDVIMDKFNRGEFDICTLIYNHFVSVLSQKPSMQQLIPFAPSTIDAANQNNDVGGGNIYNFEPSEEEILNVILPKNITVQIFRALLDSAAGEQAARMTAMDNATRNAGDMIKRISTQYNRERQAHITKELIEIISSAEAV